MHTICHGSSQQPKHIHVLNLPKCLTQYKEKTGDVTGALEHYTLSGTQYVEIPRLYWEAGQIDELEAYVKKQVRPKRHAVESAAYC